MGEEEKVGRWNELYKSIVTNSGKIFHKQYIYSLLITMTLAQNYATSIISELSKVLLNYISRGFK